MAQLIYSITAIFVLGIAFLNVNQKVLGSQDRMMFSEIALEMTSIGTELLDEIGKYPFDTGTTSGLAVAPTDLSDGTAWGTGACDPDHPDFEGCVTISDFHTKTASRTETRVYKGVTTSVPYTIPSISVAYVSETAPHDPSASATFAKEVTIVVETPALIDYNGDPVSIEMSRVYMYPDL